MHFCFRAAGVFRLDIDMAAGLDNRAGCAADTRADLLRCLFRMSIACNNSKRIFVFFRLKCADTGLCLCIFRIDNTEVAAALGICTRNGISIRGNIYVTQRGNIRPADVRADGILRVSIGTHAADGCETD